MKMVELSIPRLYPAQREVRDKASLYNVLCWGRRAGKTTFGADLVVHTVFDKRGKFGWFAPSYKVLNPIWDYYVRLFEPLTIERNEKDHSLKLLGGGKIECWSMDSGLVARSRDYDRVVVDEAAFTPGLKLRWEKEIRPTLVDRSGDAFFFSTPDGENDFKELYDLANYDPEWAHFHLPTWDNPYLPQKERDRVYKLAEIDRDPVARQEYGAEFLSGGMNFVHGEWVDACTLNADHWQPLPPFTPICVGIDVGAKNDLFAITGWGRSQEVRDAYGNLIKGRRYKPMFAKIFHPEELKGPDGKVDFSKPKAFLREVARNYNVLVFAYDPYQAWGLADDLGVSGEGIGIFEEFPQGQKRVMGDSLFYTLIRDMEIEMSYHDEGHKELAQHMKNADAKIEGEDKRRLVKRTDSLKIDSAVSSSMSILALQDYYV